MKKFEGIEGGQKQGDAFLRTRGRPSAYGPARIVEKIAIAAGDQPICPAKDRTDFVPQRMVAPVAGSDWFVCEKRFGDTALGRATPPSVMGAQVEDVTYLRLPRQRAKAWSGRPAVQCSPEASCGVDADFEGIIERQDDGLDLRRVILPVDDEMVRAGGGGPASVLMAAVDLLTNAVET